MRVLLDVDGVLADFVGGLCRDLTARGFPRTPDDIRHWELRDTLPANELRECHEIMATPGFCHGLPWYEGARDFVRTVRDEHELHILTAPFDGSETWMRERVAWLANDVPRDRVHFMSGKWKHLVAGDVLVEDHPLNAAAWLDANPRGIAALVDRPWNKPASNQWAWHSRMYRVANFEDALRVVRNV